MGELEGRGANREETNNFRAYDVAVQFSYAKELGDNKLMGTSVKLIRQQIEEESASSIGIDIGLQRKLTGNINLGLAVRNLGPKIKFINEGYNLPLTIGLGAGLTIGGVTLAVDTNYEPIEEKVKLCMGTEYMPIQFISLRGGYFVNLVNNAIRAENKKIIDPSKGLGGGIGLNILNYNLNYAVVPYVDLGTTHRVSFLVKF